jgi:hypothetical protein
MVARRSDRRAGLHRTLDSDIRPSSSAPASDARMGRSGWNGLWRLWSVPYAAPGHGLGRALPTWWLGSATVGRSPQTMEWAESAGTSRSAAPAQSLTLM